jgi:hypothetical protein
MTEAQKISISIQDEIYKQVDEILNKLNICFLDLNDFGDLYHADGTKRIFKFELFEKENGYLQFNKLVFRKYETYKKKKLFTLKHLKKNVLFTEFCFYSDVLSFFERNEKDNFKKYIECLEVFAEYIGYEMKIELLNVIHYKISFDKIK